MSKSIQTSEALQVNFPQTSNVISRQSFTIVEDSIDEHRLSPGEERTYRKLKRLIRLGRGVCEWCHRQLCAYLGISDSTLRRHLRRLRAALLLVIRHRPPARGSRLSETNIYSLPGGGVVKNEPQVLKANSLKTTAPPLARRIENHNPAMKKLYEWNGVLQGQLRSLRAMVRGQKQEVRRAPSDSWMVYDPNNERDWGGTR